MSKLLYMVDWMCTELIYVGDTSGQIVPYPHWTYCVHSDALGHGSFMGVCEMATGWSPVGTGVLVSIWGHASVLQQWRELKFLLFLHILWLISPVSCMYSRMKACQKNNKETSMTTLSHTTQFPYISGTQMSSTLAVYNQCTFNVHQTFV